MGRVSGLWILLNESKQRQGEAQISKRSMNNAAKPCWLKQILLSDILKISFNIFLEKFPKPFPSRCNRAHDCKTFFLHKRKIHTCCILCNKYSLKRDSYRGESERWCNIFLFQVPSRSYFSSCSFHFTVVVVLRWDRSIRDARLYDGLQEFFTLIRFLLYDSDE